MALFQDIQLRGAIFFFFFFVEQTFLTTGASTADLKVNDPVFEVGGDIYTYTQWIFTSEQYTTDIYSKYYFSLKTVIPMFRVPSTTL